MYNVAIVGCGYWGPNLIRNFNSLENSTVRAICDMSESRLAHMNTLYPAAETTTDFDVLINDPEIHAIVIATPVSTHFNQGSCLTTVAMEANTTQFIIYYLTYSGIFLHHEYFMAFIQQSSNQIVAYPATANDYDIHLFPTSAIQSFLQ